MAQQEAVHFSQSLQGKWRCPKGDALVVIAFTGYYWSMSHRKGAPTLSGTWSMQRIDSRRYGGLGWAIALNAQQLTESRGLQAAGAVARTAGIFGGPRLRAAAGASLAVRRAASQRSQAAALTNRWLYILHGWQINPAGIMQAVTVADSRSLTRMLQWQRA